MFVLIFIMTRFLRLFQTVALHREYIRPNYITMLTDESKETTGIDENLLFSSDVDLDGALRNVNLFRSMFDSHRIRIKIHFQFDKFLQDNQFHPENNVQLTFLCENCLHLRQCLHPESVKKSSKPLANYYWSYFDLRHEFERFYETTECHNLNAMLESKD